MQRSRCYTFLQYVLSIISGCVVLVTTSDTYFVPEASETFFAAHNALHWRLNNARWLTIPNGHAHNVVAFLCLEFAIGDCKAPFSKGQHLPIEVRGRRGI